MAAFVTQEVGFDVPLGDWEDHSTTVLTYPNGLRVTLARRESRTRSLLDVASEYMAELRRGLPRFEALETKPGAVNGLEVVTYSFRHADSESTRHVQLSVIACSVFNLFLGASAPEQRRTLVDEVHRAMCLSLRLRTGRST